MLIKTNVLNTQTMPWAELRTYEQNSLKAVTGRDIQRLKPGSTGYVHPTQKPVALLEALLTNSSKAGDTVLDLFGGSGSTMVACHKLGRSARLAEKDPKYCDVIVARMRRLWPDTEIKRNGELYAPTTREN